MKKIKTVLIMGAIVVFGIFYLSVEKLHAIGPPESGEFFWVEPVTEICELPGNSIYYWYCNGEIYFTPPPPPAFGEPPCQFFVVESKGLMDRCDSGGQYFCNDGYCRSE